MKLGFVVRVYYPARGGVETLMHHVCTALAGRHEVTVIAQSVDNSPSGRLGTSLLAPAPFEPFFDGDVRVIPFRTSAAARTAMLPLAAQSVPGFSRYAFGRARLAYSEIYGRAIQRSLARQLRGSALVHAWSTDLIGAGA